MKVERASHCLYQIRYHMVFCIKYRHSLLLVEERCEYLKQVFKEIGERYWFELEEMGTDGDHVHVFVGAASKYAPSWVIELGEVTLLQQQEENQPRRLQGLGAGNMVGEMDFFLQSVYQASATVEQPSTLYRLSQIAMQQMRQERPEVAATFQEFVIQALSDRLTQTYQEVADLLQ